MLHTYSNNDNRIKYLHNRCLQLIYCDQISSYEQLLKNYESISMDHKNRQALATWMFRNIESLSPGITIAIFVRRAGNHYKLCHLNDFQIFKRKFGLPRTKNLKRRFHRNQ